MGNLEDITLYSFTQQRFLRLADNLSLYSADNCPSQFCPQPKIFSKYMNELRAEGDPLDIEAAFKMTYEAVKKANKEIENQTRAEYGLPSIKPKECN